jgi:hypothetical protein
MCTRLTEASASFFVQELAHLVIRMIWSELLLPAYHFRHPVTGDTEAYAQRIDLLAHSLFLPAVADVNGDVTSNA